MGSLIELNSADGHAFRGYVAGSPGQGGLVLCHDDAGMSRACCSLADRLARAGYYVIVPALFDRTDPALRPGYAPADRAASRAVARELPLDVVSLDVAAAGAALSQPVLGLVGLGWGATMVWRMASRSPRYSAAIGFYGAGIAKVLDEAPRCPVQLHIGDFDDDIGGHHIATIRRDRPNARIEMYSGARQDFLIEETELYEPMATATAMDNTLLFLRRYMVPVAEAACEPVEVQAAPLVESAPVVEKEAAVLALVRPVWQPRPRQVFGRRAVG